jgi:hypothetical protein
MTSSRLSADALVSEYLTKMRRAADLRFTLQEMARERRALVAALKRRGIPLPTVEHVPVYVGPDAQPAQVTRTALPPPPSVIILDPSLGDFPEDPESADRADDFVQFMSQFESEPSESHA